MRDTVEITQLLTILTTTDGEQLQHLSEKDLFLLERLHCDTNLLKHLQQHELFSEISSTQIAQYLSNLSQHLLYLFIADTRFKNQTRYLAVIDRALTRKEPLAAYHKLSCFSLVPITNPQHFQLLK